MDLNYNIYGKRRKMTSFGPQGNLWQEREGDERNGFILIILFLSSVLLSTDAATPELVDKVCSKYFADTYSFCVKALVRDPRSSTGDLKVLASISVQGTLTSATNTQRYIDQLLRKRTQPEREYLIRCKHNYSVTISLLEDSLKTLSSSNLRPTTLAVRANVDECETAFPSHPSTLSSSNQMVIKLNDISIVINVNDQLP
ncbi:putative invertase inhibitor [Papaver somniferum]|uniref:putative invertase inhibitor n=1 Tax=Papaver somniferum TaxID=3469 RepID=UPI000E6FF364|nr:putative invertase inhibitor [Papaver somniferum]